MEETYEWLMGLKRSHRIGLVLTAILLFGGLNVWLGTEPAREEAYKQRAIEEMKAEYATMVSRCSKQAKSCTIITDNWVKARGEAFPIEDSDGWPEYRLEYRSKDELDFSTAFILIGEAVDKTNKGVVEERYMIGHAGKHGFDEKRRCYYAEFIPLQEGTLVDNNPRRVLAGYVVQCQLLNWQVEFELERSGKK